MNTRTMQHILAVVLGCLLGACAAAPRQARPTLAEAWGIEVTAVRLSAARSMVDFRYRILEPALARSVTNGIHEPYLVDRATGKVLGVPKPAKVGALRQTVRNGDPVAGRIYFILFGNPGRLLSPGSEVDVVIGDFRAEGLTVE